MPFPEILPYFYIIISSICYNFIRPRSGTTSFDFDLNVVHDINEFFTIMLTAQTRQNA